MLEGQSLKSHETLFHTILVNLNNLLSRLVDFLWCIKKCFLLLKKVDKISHLLVFLADVRQVILPRLVVEEGGADDHAARGIQHVDHGLRVARGNLHRRVLLWGGRPTYQQRRSARKQINLITSVSDLYPAAILPPSLACPVLWPPLSCRYCWWQFVTALTAEDFPGSDCWAGWAKGVKPFSKSKKCSLTQYFMIILYNCTTKPKNPLGNNYIKNFAIFENLQFFILMY